MTYLRESRQRHLALQRFDETRQIIHEAQARKLDNFISTMLSTLLPFSGRTPRRWRNSNSGLRVSPIMRIWTGARIRHRGVRRSSWQGAGTDQAGGGLRHHERTTRKTGQSGRRLLLARSRLRQCCGSPAVCGRGFEAGSHESGRRESKPRLRLPWRAIRHEPSPWRKTWGNASRWTHRCSRFGCQRFRRNWR